MLKTQDIPYLVRTEKALDMTLQYIWKNILDVDKNGRDPRFVDKEGIAMGIEFYWIEDSINA